MNEMTAPVSGEDDVAWGVQARKEPRWPASLAVLAILILYGTLPSRYTLGPGFLIPLIAGALLVGLTILAPHRTHGESMVQRVGSVALIAIVNVANVISLAFLVDHLLHGSKASGNQLLVSSVQIWLTNILIFALWYWELDRGGPDERTMPHHRRPDFLFPQMTTPHCAASDWSPSFVDYLYLAFTNATAFSPTDTLPLTGWAKLLMMVQSLASLLTVALVAARAVNILT